MYEIATYENKCPEIEDAKAFHQHKYFKQCKSAEDNGTLIISGTQLKEINDNDKEKEIISMGENCDDLEIVILYMNHLTKLPEKLLEFKNLICIQNNKFQEIHEFDKLKILNMHGNYLSHIPTEITTFKNLATLSWR